MVLRHCTFKAYTIAHMSYGNHHTLIANEVHETTMTTVVHHVLIVGAGPGGLAVAARLREPTPSAVFTDAEHNRDQWLKKHSGRMNLRPRGSETARSKCSSTGRRNADRYGTSSCSFRNIIADSYFIIQRQYGRVRRTEVQYQGRGQQRR